MDIVGLRETIGLIAGILTTLAFVPQVLRVWRTRSATDISLPAFASLVIGIVLWIVYGLLLDSVALLLANGVTLFLALGILVGKIRFGLRD